MYKGEELLCMGTREEICEEMNIAEQTFRVYRSNIYKRTKYAKGKKRRIIVRIDGI